MKLPQISAYFSLSLDGKIITADDFWEKVQIKADAVLEGDIACVKATIVARGERVKFAKSTSKNHGTSRGTSRYLRGVLENLADKHGVRTMTCEVGTELFHTLIKGGFVQKLHVGFVPAIMGDVTAPTLLGAVPMAHLTHSIPLRLESFRKVRGKTVAIYRVLNGRQAR